jgi:hypothetical protein
MKRLALSLLLVAYFGSTALVVAQDTAGDEENAARRWSPLFRKHASEYEILVQGDDTPLKLVDKPLLNWSQPVRGGAEGVVFLWTREEVPAVMATFFVWPTADGKQGVAHERHSLVQEKLTGTFRERRWDAPGKAIEWKQVDLKTPPAPTAERRLRQMREIAETLQAESVDRKDKKWDLRLLPKPIYRYASANGAPVIDGSIFAFVEGTDLEIAVLIQARKTKSEVVWEMAFARMSDFQLTVRRDKEVLWQVPIKEGDDTTSNYSCPTVEFRDSPDDK